MFSEEEGDDGLFLLVKLLSERLAADNDSVLLGRSDLPMVCTAIVRRCCAVCS